MVEQVQGELSAMAFVSIVVGVSTWILSISQTPKSVYKLSFSGIF